jgi:hypothetical protein
MAFRLPFLVIRTALVVAAALALSATSAEAREAKPPFAPTSIWNQPLRDNARLAPNSHRLVRELLRQRQTSLPWINTTIYSTPVYTVGPGTPTSAVYIDTPSVLFTNRADADAVQRQLAAVPIPDHARPSAGHNRHMVIWQPSTDTMWELWNAHRIPDEKSPWKTDSILGWHAAWGARIDNVSRNAGTNPAPFGATASGLPLAGGLIRLSEFRGNAPIKHALAVGIHDIEAGTTAWPASRTDGAFTGRNAIPMGTRFRLDARVNIDKLPMTPVGKRMARAVQRYGMIVRDHADDSIVFYGEDPTPTGSNPYPRIFGGLRPDHVLAGFPWDRLQAVAPRPRP